MVKTRLPSEQAGQGQEQASSAQSPPSSKNKKRAQTQRKSNRVWRFLSYAFVAGIFGFVSFYTGKKFGEGREQIYNNLNQSTQQLAEQRFYSATLNNDGLEDLVVFDSSGRGTAYIRMENGSYKTLEDVQREKLDAFNKKQEKEKTDFEAEQKKYQDRVKQEINKIAEGKVKVIPRK